MDLLTNFRRSLRLALLVSAFVLFTVQLFAQEDIDRAPIIISHPDSTRAFTVSADSGLYDPVSKVFAPGGKTRFGIFVTNVELLEREGADAFRADVQLANGKRFGLPVEGFEQLRDSPWVYLMTVRLDDRIGSVGDVLLRVGWRGMASNRVRLSIGFEGGKMPDDPGSKPTPMPEREPAANGVTEDLSQLPWNGNLVRFMNQATFGANSAVELRLRRIGISAWLNEQMEDKFDASGAQRFSAIPYPNLALQVTNPPTGCTGLCLRDNYTMYPIQNWFFREAIYGEDQQLRRRVSWALGQIWVVSGRETVQPSRMLPYINTIDRHAFGNFRDLMRDMTLNPAMGNYLDMAISTRQNPNENYAREILQLFTIGLYMLNEDGTVRTDAGGAPIPTYSQDEVNGFTKVFTGWTFCDVGCVNSRPGIKNYIDPLVLNEANHDTTEKHVLNYPGSVAVIPAGLPAQQDFELAIDNIFYHPNVGPFVGKLLIQQLVTSNPSAAYVRRVAAAFNNNGSGIRGDMKTVIRAILTDPEARGNFKTHPDYGHLREPVVFLTGFLRNMNPTAQPGSPNACKNQSDGVLNGVTQLLDQDVFNPPSVFNYYPMDYVLQGTTLTAPEFGIFSTGTALKRPNAVNSLIFGIGIPRDGNATCGTRLDLSRWIALAESDASGAILVDTMNRDFLHGAMSAGMRNHVIGAVQAVASTDHLKRARTALYLVLTSPQFQVQR